MLKLYPLVKLYVLLRRLLPFIGRSRLLVPDWELAPFSFESDWYRPNPPLKQGTHMNARYTGVNYLQYVLDILANQLSMYHRVREHLSESGGTDDQATNETRFRAAQMSFDAMVAIDRSRCNFSSHHPILLVPYEADEAELVWTTAGRLRSRVDACEVAEYICAALSAGRTVTVLPAYAASTLTQVYPATSS